MDKESLFKLIRKEEVIIWAGAGCSIDAGYPSGQKLGKIILNELSAQEKTKINNNLTLPDLAEEFFRIKGNNKNSLLRILNKSFIDFKPKTTDLHDKLANIPHFKSILTTNYDRLVENSFGTNGQLVYSSKQIPYLEKDKTHIFKVHGDLSEPDSIILTSSDYINFFKSSNENNVFWTSIKERLSTNNVLFLGYNLEDPNISVIFDKITDELNSHRKECFLVAPKMAEHKVNDLIRKGINYIDATAGEIIDELYQNLKENIIDDMEKGITTVDTFRKFLQNNNLISDLKGTPDSFKINSLDSIEGTIERNMNLTFKNDPDFIKELNEFIKGEKVGEMVIPEDKLIDVDFRYGGLKYPKFGEILKLEFKSSPQIISNIDIIFENGFEFLEIPVEIYFSKNFFEIHAKFKSAIIKVNLAKQSLPEYKVTFTYSHNELCSKVKDEINFFQLLSNISRGNKFTIYPDNGKTVSKSFPELLNVLDESEYLLEYFEKLKLIEQYFKVRFKNINIYSITDKSYSLVTKIIKIINGGSITFDWNDELETDLLDDSKEIIEKLKKVNETNVPVVAQHNTTEEINLHGQKINLGYKRVEYLESYVSNLVNIIEKKEQVVKIKSRCNKIKVSYSKEAKIEKT